MANTTDFISAVYDQLAKFLSVDAGSTNFLQMAWPGYSLSPTDFRRADAPNGPYDPDVAKEALSHLANIVPAFSKARFENSGYEVDDLYEIVLTSAIPMGATQDTVAANPIYRLFSDAQYEFTTARRGVHDDPNAYYYPCSATPSNWYDESAAQGWTTINLSQSDVKPASDAGSSFGKSGGLEMARAAVWRLKPSVADSVVLRKNLDSVLGKAGVFRRGVKVPGPAAAPVPAAAPGPAAPVMLKRGLDPGLVGALKRGAPGVAAPTLHPDLARSLFTRASGPTPVLKRGAVDVGRVDLQRRDLGIADLASRFALKAALDRQLPSKPPSPATDGFSISFRLCRVNLDRPWLKLALLSTKNWWMFDTPGGEYSSGSADSNPGMFPMLTTSFIVIRDLKITANWSQEDRANLGNAAGFGCFDLRDGTVNNNTIEVKGLQIIAWISRLMPKLPPLSPP
ncbi:hypothetical protein [Nannocystis sp.]|uniref:hypothetical protein n=1 Tax=Nannocystis sp. TaxID=1962667 RepID=UPI002426ACB8|nr:hypothetical protein [Nannocystis sp.]MBK7830303.1 hypothetical protein [Nannocystis sp.]MBK9752274.1 hypothetical protein [Nannocystis sp.]